ncbi:3-hydroxyacyl-CoA dehydrogenase [Yinghuangia sp. YIM S09857]|uniref:3-hydroxyacyl-CoA dehydrogenase n=1 Tax=Yinghuangia sp. YIM S09857 TaxID=3436929 RepID=UPI003F53D3FF
MHIRIVGAGVMGRGIAQWAATAGHTVELCDARPASVPEALTFVEDMLRRAVRNGRMSSEDAADARARITAVDAPTAPGPAVDLVVEAIHEDLAAKRELFRALEDALPAEAVFATNTSSLTVTGIAAGLADPSRLAGLHFFNPVPLMRIAEVVPGARTRAEIPGMLAEFVRGTGHAAVVVADTPGFLVNHAGRGLATEAFALLEESVSDAVGIDRIARDVLGLRMGPFELMDLTGLDVTASVTDTIWRGFAHSDRLRPSVVAANRVAAGLLGRKTGRGFYTYSGSGSRPEVPAEAPVDGDADRPVWVPGDGADTEALRQFLGRAGVLLRDGASPPPDAVVLVPTWGTTVAAAVASAGLPAGRSLGVDPLSLAARRRVLAVTPATDPVAARDARAVLARAGAGEAPRRVTVVRDTAGSVAQRLLASIVSVAASIAERSIADPADIDTAVVAGLGYPAGPLSWGDKLGARRMLALHEGLHRSTGDPRYRPTRWVAERVQLGLPLTESGTPPTLTERVAYRT